MPLTERSTRLLVAQNAMFWSLRFENGSVQSVSTWSDPRGGSAQSGQAWVERGVGEERLRGLAGEPGPVCEGGQNSRGCDANAMRRRRAVRKQPETFCCTFSIRRSRSAWLLSKGMVRSSRKASTSSCPSQRRSSRLRAGDCFMRPRWRAAADRRWIGGEAGGQEVLIASNEAVALLLGADAGSRCSGLVGGGLHLPQQVFEVFGPGLLILLFQIGQLAQMVDIAQRMAALASGCDRASSRRGHSPLVGR